MENIGIAGTESQLTVSQRLGILPKETVGQSAISPSGSQGSRKFSRKNLKVCENENVSGMVTEK